MNLYILGIESSCDDTSAAVLCNNQILSNVIAGQAVHAQYGGVVPELASRAHQQNIIPVVDTALKQAKISFDQLSAVAYTRGPGLLGSLLVGNAFSKAFTYALQLPLIEVDHLEGHILSHFIFNEKNIYPAFPFLCLLVSGGHTQIMLVKDFFTFEIIGKTIDDAAGEAFDKSAKILGFPYPGGPMIDKLAQTGISNAYTFNQANMSGYNYSFSGLKTSFLYFLRDKLKENPNFITENVTDLAASMQKAICDTLMKKLIKAAKDFNINEIAIAGGVSANSGLQTMLKKTATEKKWNIYIPPFQLTTDNAAMIAIAGYYKYMKKDFANLNSIPYTKSKY